MDNLGDQCVVKFGHLLFIAYHMERVQEPTSKLKRVFLKIKQKLRSQLSGDASENRIRRRKALVQLLTRRLTLIKLVSSFRHVNYNIQWALELHYLSLDICGCWSFLSLA